MPSLRRKSHASPWPLWLLVLAWFCANCPQTLICTAVVWFGEAGSFSHQQRLTAAVAHVLSGEKTPDVFARSAAAPDRPFTPLVPASATLKKILLAVDRTVELLPPVARAIVRARDEASLRGILRAPPPHGPPRAGQIA